MICQICYTRQAEHMHHLFSQSKANKKMYGKILEIDRNKMPVCSICHLNKSIPKYTELEFCRVMGIMPRSKELISKIDQGKIERFWK